MTDIRQEDLDRLDQMFEEAEKAAVADWLDDLYTHLVEGDRYLKQVVDHTLPGQMGSADQPGAEEMFWGAIPAIFAYPPKKIPPIVRYAMKRLAKIKVHGHSIIPQTTIKPEQRWNEFLKRAEKDGVVDDSGDIWGTQKYQQLDWRWIQSLLDSYLTPKKDKLYNKAGQVIPIGDNVCIGLIGDWGTGTAPAIKVIKAAAAAGPDYLVHLGDVYYSGRDSSFWHRLDHTAEEKSKFVDIWRKKAKNITSFALNSNHEMYSKARGYFNDALKSKPFLTQKRASHFLLHNGDWQIFGLDTAWAAKPYLYMEGVLTEDQTSFLAAHVDPNKKIILLSHHTGLSTDGTRVRDKIWGQIETALKGRQPDYWYWGHIHNGIVYNGVGRTPEARNQTRCRCVGHGAVPFGYAWGLEKYKGDGKPIAYFSHEKRGSSNELKNGFATLELSGTAITEKFFTEDGECVWSAAPGMAVSHELVADPT